MTADRDYPKLEKQPLTLVVAEFRFAPLDLDSDALWTFRANLDERMGARAKQHTVQNAHLGPNGLQVDASLLLRWVEERAGETVQLQSDRLIFATTRYPRFPGFSGKVRTLLVDLNDALAIHNIQRIGLRYNDAVVPDPDEDLSDYLQPPFMPWTTIGNEPKPVFQHLTETRLNTNCGILVIRALLGRHGRGFMPDVQDQFGLSTPIQIPNDRATAVLDFDHFWQSSDQTNDEIDVDKAMQRLDALHEPAREAFWSVTTDHARKEKWR